MRMQTTQKGRKCDVRRVATVSSFLSIIEKTYSEWELSDSAISIWFRGQDDAMWPLLPTLHRGPHGTARFEKEMVRDFMLHSRLHLDVAPANYLEWLFIMQHYGVRTRLIDWTENPLAALYFSVSDSNSTSHGCVWLLDPWSLNRFSLGHKTIPVSESELMKRFFRNSSPSPSPIYPVAIRPQRITPRIIAQRGCFTVHGSRTDPLEEVASRDVPNVRLIKLVIDNECKPSLLKQLYSCGISEYSLFPGLEGLAREISFRYSQRFMGVAPLASSERM